MMRDPEAALERQQRQVSSKPLDLADADLLSGALGRESVQIRVIAVLDLAARGAFATRPIGRIRREAQQPRRKIQGERRLADALRPYEQQRVGGLPVSMARSTSRSAAG